MYRGGKGYDGGKGGGKSFERDRYGGNAWGKYRRDYQPSADSWNNSYEPSREEKRSSATEPPQHRDGGGKGSVREPQSRHTASDDEMQGLIRLEKRLDSVQKEFKQALHNKSQKENDKFDIIFGILSELQNRHAQIEESVQDLAAHAPMMSVSMGGAAHDQMGQPQQFAGGSAMPQQYGQIAEMPGNMALQPPMQQFGGMMSPDGSQAIMTMAPMQQVIVMPSSNGATPMVPHMGMQSGLEMGSFNTEQQLHPAQPSAAETPAAPAAIEAHSASEKNQDSASSTTATASSVDGGSPGTPSEATAATSSSSVKAWDKDRRWKVVNLDDGTSLPVVNQSVPCGPGIGREASDDLVVTWLKNGDTVRQLGHSKKMKGYMVMPVRVISTDGDSEEELDGYVTRRSVDKLRDNGDIIWFEEVEVGSRRQA